MTAALPLSCALAVLAMLADGWTTRRLLLRPGYREANPVRLAMIRLFGINGGTIGVGVAASALLVLANHSGADPLGVVVSNLFVAAIFGIAAYWNASSFTKGNKP